MTIDFDTSTQTVQQRQANERFIENTLADVLPERGEFVGDGVARTAGGVVYEGRIPVLRPFSEVEKKRPKFLDYPMIPVGTLTLIAGRAAVSKSTLSLTRAALATRGLLEGDWKDRPVNVAVSNIEDSPSMQRMRLEAAGADLDHISPLILQDVHDSVATDDPRARIPEDLPRIAREFQEKDVRMWIIDPITSCIGGDTNKRDDVRHALDPLAAFAQELDIAIVGILHFNKGGGYASDKLSGSHAFRDSVRSLLLVARDDETGDCVVTIDKSSYTMEQGTSYSYGLMSQNVQDDAGEVVSVPKVTGFMPTERNVNEVINRNMEQAMPDPQPVERGEVLEWLAEYLKDGPVPFKDIATAASAEGYTRRQLNNARERSDGLIASVPDPTWQGRGQKRLWILTGTPSITSPSLARGGTERGSNHGSIQTPMIPTPPITSANTSAFQAPAREDTGTNSQENRP